MRDSLVNYTEVATTSWSSKVKINNQTHNISYVHSYTVSLMIKNAQWLKKYNLNILNSKNTSRMATLSEAR